MNSEELEQSLRSEFENYLKDVAAEMRSDVSELKAKVEAEFDAHRTRIDEAFESFSQRFAGDHEFDTAFTESVVEHLRLARDEGAKITATAIAEAEELERTTKPDVSFAAVKDAIADISTKDSQSAILKALVSHAANFAPRGAFFIIKSDHFAGWKVFGKEAGTAESAIRDIHFSADRDSILGKSVSSLQTVEGAFGSYPEDTLFLDPLQFGRPDRMYAIPLVARGRGVAVLYADYGTGGVTLNTDILETLVKVAGMTVELLASAKGHTDEETQSSFHGMGTETHTSDRPVSATIEPAVPAEPEPAVDSSGFSFQEAMPTAIEYAPEPTFEAPQFETSDQTAFEPAGEVAEYSASVEEYSSDTSVSSDFSSFDPNSIPEIEPSGSQIDTAAIFDRANAQQPNPYESAPFDQPAAHSVPDVPIAPPTEPIPAVPRARLSDRQIDLPVEVAEDERRLHNDARRFARLLVSEIKLYNEKKVQEGRESSDLYERLKEAIDRSREMYDKRVQPPVAAKFDYFHYELVNSLAEGDEARLGHDYAGAKV